MTVKIIRHEGKPSKFVIDAGNVRMATPISGLYYDFNYGGRVQLPPGDFSVQFKDMKNFVTFSSEHIGDTIVNTPVAYYVPYDIEIFSGGELVHTVQFNLQGKNVHIEMMTLGKLGDILSFAPSVNGFWQEHGCNVFVTLPEEYADILQSAYPQIKFIGVKKTMKDGEKEFDSSAWKQLPKDIYATYYMETAKDKELSPVDGRIVGLREIGAQTLGVKLKERYFSPIPPSAAAVAKGRSREPYVCISVCAGADWKEWKHPDGWAQVVHYLKKKNYRVICIDKDIESNKGLFTSLKKEGAEFFSGEKPLQERVDIIWGAEFFIGISSGLSWLAWAAGADVILISGITLPYTEFYTPYRIYNRIVCHGCWNDTDIHGSDINNFCPRFGGTDRKFECSLEITPAYVCSYIDRAVENHKKVLILKSV